jgi:WD40 repeat protein
MVRIWNAATGALVMELSGHSGAVTSVAYSPDGSLLASASEDGSVKIWNAANGSLARTISLPGCIVQSVAWSPSGAAVAAGSWGTADAPWSHNVSVWNPSTGAYQYNLSNSVNPINAVAWSPDGSAIAVGHNGEGDYSPIAGAPSGLPVQNFNVTLWTVATKTAQYLGQHTNSVSSVAFSADGKLLASSSIDGSVKVWNATTGASMNDIYSSGGAVNSVSWGPNGTLAAGLANGTVDVYGWPKLNSTILRTMPGHLGDVTSLDWSQSANRIASGSADAKTLVRVADTGAAAAESQRLPNTVRSVKISPNGTHFATGSGNSAIYHKSESHIWCAVSGDGGANWPIQSRVDSVGGFFMGSPSIGMAENGDIGVTWYEARSGGLPSIFYANSTDGGLTFKQDVKISSGVGSKLSPSLAMDSGGVGHMVWHDERDKDTTSYEDNFDIYYGRSDAPGANVRVNATAVSVRQLSADIDVSPDGMTMAVAWRESASVVVIKSAASTDGGATFGTPDVVNDGTDGDRYMPTVCLSGGDINVAWYDYRRGDPNVYFSSTTLSDSWPPSILGVSPASGAIDVSAYSPIVVKFSEPVSGATVAGAFTISTGGSIWTGGDMTLTMSAYGDKATLTPLGWHLMYSTTYTVTITASVDDMSGNTMRSPMSWSFTTGLDKDGPMIELVSAPETVQYNGVATVVADVVDYTGLASVSLHYKLNGTGNFSTVEMVSDSTSSHAASIPAQWALGELLYYITANDTLGNLAGYPVNYTNGSYLSADVVDGIAPTIIHSAQAVVDFQAELTLGATVVDDIELASVYLEYNTVASDVTQVVEMANVGGSNYTATIPAQNDTGTFGYRIIAIDGSNNTGSTMFYPVQATDGVAPVIAAADAVQLDDGSIVVTASATDNHRIDSITIHFIPVGGSKYIEKEMSAVGNGTFTVSILEQEQTGTFRYYVNATDPSSNTASTLSMNEGKPYSVWVDGKLPPMSIILLVSVIVIVIGLAALVYLLRFRRRGGKKKSAILGQPEHPLESVNVSGKAAEEPESPEPGHGSKTL